MVDDTEKYLLGPILKIGIGSLREGTVTGDENQGDEHRLDTALNGDAYVWSTAHPDELAAVLDAYGATKEKAFNKKRVSFR